MVHLVATKGWWRAPALVSRTLGAKGGTRTLTGVTRQILSLVRLPIPPLSQCCEIHCIATGHFLARRADRGSGADSVGAMSAQTVARDRQNRYFETGRASRQQGHRPRAAEELAGANYPVVWHRGVVAPSWAESYGVSREETAFPFELPATPFCHSDSCPAVRCRMFWTGQRRLDDARQQLRRKQ